jgi:Major intrinsic protein
VASEQVLNTSVRRRNAVVLLHGHQLERNLARAVTAEAAGTFVLVLAITSTAVAATLSRAVAGAPYGSLAVPVAGGLALAIGVASVGYISGAHLNPAVTLGLAVNRHFPWAYAPGYVIAQFAGATAAAAATWGLNRGSGQVDRRTWRSGPGSRGFRGAGTRRGSCCHLSCWSWWSLRWPPTAGFPVASLPWPSAPPSR